MGVDKNQLAGSHGASNRRKHSQMERMGAVLLPLRIPFGDYIAVNDEIMDLIDRKGKDLHKKDLQDLITLSIDTKKSLSEISQNICSKQHERFKSELLKAGGRMTLLIEEADIESLEDVYFWQNPRLKQNPKAVKGEALYKSLCTIRDEYGVKIQFCNRSETGKRIIEILGEGENV